MVILRNFEYKRPNLNLSEMMYKKGKNVKKPYIRMGEATKVIFHIEQGTLRWGIDVYNVLIRYSTKEITEDYCERIFYAVSEEQYENVIALLEAVVRNCE